MSFIWGFNKYLIISICYYLNACVSRHRSHLAEGVFSALQAKPDQPVHKLRESHSRRSCGKRHEACLCHSRDGICFQHIDLAFIENHVRSAPIPALKRSVSPDGARLRLLGLSPRNPCRTSFTGGAWSVLCLVIKKRVFGPGNDFDNREGLKGVVSQDTAGDLLPVKETLNQDFMIMSKGCVDSFEQLLLGVANSDSDA